MLMLQEWLEAKPSVGMEILHTGSQRKSYESYFLIILLPSIELRMKKVELLHLPCLVSLLCTKLKKERKLFFLTKVELGLGESYIQTSQELRMLSSVTINCQITKIVMNSGSQLSEL